MGKKRTIYREIVIILAALTFFAIIGVGCGMLIADLQQSWHGTSIMQPHVNAASANTPPDGDSNTAGNGGAVIDDVVSPILIAATYQGKIGVFDGFGNTVPIDVYDIDTSSLRQYDQDQLLRGIVLNSREELMMLLEDFGS